MTNRTKIVFVIISAALAALSVAMSTQFALDMAGRTLAAVANVLGLREAPISSVIAVLVIPGLYLAFRQKRHS
jgi:hypothetical protein